MSLTKKQGKAILTVAQTVAKTGTWTDIYNAVYGLGGATASLKTATDRAAFLKSEPHRQITELIQVTREQKGDPPLLAETVSHASGYLSVRIPSAIHASLLIEAKQEGVSLNQLCAAKLCVQLAAVV
jgi:predicted HicB family RNase H-like nuclease